MWIFIAAYWNKESSDCSESELGILVRNLLGSFLRKCFLMVIKAAKFSANFARLNELNYGYPLCLIILSSFRFFSTLGSSSMSPLRFLATIVIETLCNSVPICGMHCPKPNSRRCPTVKHLDTPYGLYVASIALNAPVPDECKAHKFSHLSRKCTPLSQAVLFTIASRFFVFQNNAIESWI